MRASLWTDTLCSGKDKHKILGFQTWRHIHRKQQQKNTTKFRCSRERGVINYGGTDRKDSQRKTWGCM